MRVKIMKIKFNTYKVYFNFCNGNIDLQFSLRCVNDYVANLRIQRILQSAYINENYVNRVNNII